MKKSILTLFAFSILSGGLFAQNLDAIKNLFLLTKYKEAKTEIDKASGNSKLNTKPETFMLKANIYAALSLDNEFKNKPEGDQLANDGAAAFAKYGEMDKSLALMTDNTYQNGPVNLYSSFYSSGYNDYTAKNWKAAFEKLKKTVELSDLLIGKKIINVSLDTNALILAGITAEQSGNKDFATKYYSRLADAKLGGPDYESIYRFLVSYYFTTKDYASFEKYKALGAELYPNNDYFKYDKIDFAVGLEPDFNLKIKAVEEVLAKDPDNYKANEVLGEIIYDTLNSNHEGAVMPANAADLEKTMVAAFAKAAAAKPTVELAYIYVGDHFINKASKIGDDRTAHTKAMQARTKPGTKASPEDIKKRDDLDKAYGDALEGAKEPYEKAAALFAAKPTLDAKDKQQYRKVVSYLTDICAFKKSQAIKIKSPDAAKWTAEEKKWDERYNSIK